MSLTIENGFQIETVIKGLKCPRMIIALPNDIKCGTLLLAERDSGNILLIDAVESLPTIAKNGQGGQIMNLVAGLPDVLALAERELSVQALFSLFI